MLAEDMDDGELVVFGDSFAEKLQLGWSWTRENKEAWALSEGGLRIRTLPGGMYGVAKWSFGSTLVKSFLNIQEYGVPSSRTRLVKISC